MILLAYVLMGIGVVFQILGVLSLYRFPDVYTRAHGTTMCTTLGSISLYLGIIVYCFYSFSLQWISFSFHVLFLLVFLMLTGAAGTHAITRAAHKSGVLPVGGFDKLKEDKNV